MGEFKTPVKPPRNAVSETPFTIPPSPFLKRLGYGTGVSVFQMQRSPRVGGVRSPWAVKRLAEAAQRRRAIGLRLEEEAALLRRMEHPHVVGFRRFQKMGDGRPCLAMEACEGSLGDRIELRNEEGLGPYPPNNILKVALDISKALDYIHTKVHILHGDMKSFNILVNGDFEICKLCDFGVCLPLDESGTLMPTKSIEEYVGTQCWSAPEVVDSEGPLTSKADIFSFGLTLWEMLALEPPHVSHTDDDDSCLDDSVIVIDDTMSDAGIALYGTRPAIPDIDHEEYKNVLTIFTYTTEEDPQNRPHANHITLCVQDMLGIKEP